jgi:hypothetical protein
LKDYTIGPQRRSITCHRCGMTSYNSQDVVNLWCGKCNRFHLDQAIEQPRPAPLDAIEAMLDVLDGYHDQVVPINRQSATVRMLRAALEAPAPMQASPRNEFSDNFVYVKSGHNMNATERKSMTAADAREMQQNVAKQSVDRQRIEELAKDDPTIRSVLVMVRNGVLPYEAALEGLVVLLHQQKEAAVAVALDANARALPPILVQTDPNQAPLQLGDGETSYKAS